MRHFIADEYADQVISPDRYVKAKCGATIVGMDGSFDDWFGRFPKDCRPCAEALLSDDKEAKHG